MSERVLITGAQGFLGRYLVAHWLQHAGSCRVLGLGRSPRDDEHFAHCLSWAGAPIKAPLPAAIRPASALYDYAAADMADTSALQGIVREFKPDLVIHSAAALWDEPIERLLHSNVRATVSLLNALASAGRTQTRVVFISSGAVYGNAGPKHLPLIEDGPRAPVDLYGVSKLAAEEACRVLGSAHGIKPIVARVFNPIGAGQDERHLVARLASQLAAIEAGALPPELSIGPMDASRDFMDARDAAHAVHSLSRAGTDGQAYNVASGQETVCELVLQIMLQNVDVKPTVTVASAERTGGVSRHFADVSRLHNLGFRPAYSLEASLAGILDYYRAQVSPLATQNQGRR